MLRHGGLTPLGVATLVPSCTNLLAARLAALAQWVGRPERISGQAQLRCQRDHSVFGSLTWPCVAGIIVTFGGWVGCEQEFRGRCPRHRHTDAALSLPASFLVQTG